MLWSDLMRNRLKYGIPAAVGLGAAGLAAREGEDPIASLGAGVAGTLGGAAGLLAARELAGKYAPGLVAGLQTKAANASDALLESAATMRDGGMRQSALLNTAEMIPQMAQQATERGMAKAAAVGLVPASAAAAGLGGMAAGQAISAVGNMAGLAIDPEAPGSSNTSNSRMSMQMPAMRMY